MIMKLLNIIQKSGEQHQMGFSSHIFKLIFPVLVNFPEVGKKYFLDTEHDEPSFAGFFNVSTLL